MLFLLLYQPVGETTRWNSEGDSDPKSDGLWFPLIITKVLLGLSLFFYALSSTLTEAAKSLSNLLDHTLLQPYLKQCASERLLITIRIECSHQEKGRRSSSSSNSKSSGKVVTYLGEYAYPYGACESLGEATVDRRAFPVVVLHSRALPVAAPTSPEMFVNVERIKNDAKEQCKKLDKTCVVTVLYSLPSMKPVQLVKFQEFWFYTKATYFLFWLLGLSFLYNVLFVLLAGSVEVDFKKTLHDTAEARVTPPMFAMPANALFDMQRANAELLNHTFEMARAGNLSGVAKMAAEQATLRQQMEASSAVTALGTQL